MYAKLFSQILESTLWTTESLETKILWITMLAKADQEGIVGSTIPGLAHLAGISVEDCKAGIGKFLSPDEYSRTQESEGRRIEAIDGGWLLLNYTKYREIASKSHQREMARERVARHRANKKAGGVTPVKRKKKKCNGSRSASASASKFRKEVFGHWLETFGKKSKLDAKRDRSIKARLDEGYTVADLKRVCDNIKASKYHQGDNKSGAVYDSIDLLFRDADHVDKYLALSRTNGQQQQEQTPEQKAATKKRVDRLVAMGLERKAQ